MVDDSGLIISFFHNSNLDCYSHYTELLKALVCTIYMQSEYFTLFAIMCCYERIRKD